MATVEEARDQFINLANNLESVVMEEVTKLEGDMAELNREQLRRGKDATGKDTPQYAKSTGKSGRIKFRETGKYYSGIKAEVKGKSINMTSTDPKVKYL